jgi:hypothetical protein
VAQLKPDPLPSLTVVTGGAGGYKVELVDSSLRRSTCAQVLATGAPAR